MQTTVEAAAQAVQHFEETALAFFAKLIEEENV